MTDESTRTFFVTSVAWGRRSIFQTERMSSLFIEKLQKDRAMGRYQIHEFVVMKDHIHLLITPSGEIPLEKAMQYIKGGFSFLAKKSLGSNLEIWQEGFTFERVKGPEAYAGFKNYIWQNPVKKYLLESPKGYRWSSASGEFDVDPVPPGLKPEI